MELTISNINVCMASSLLLFTLKRSYWGNLYELCSLELVLHPKTQDKQNSHAVYFWILSLKFANFCNKNSLVKKIIVSYLMALD